MLKQLLAFVLTAALIVETPATAYAAEQAPVPVEDSVQGLTEEGDEADTSSQDGTEIGDTGDSMLEEDADASAIDTDTGTEDSDETDGSDAAVAADETDEDAVEDIESGNAYVVQEAVEPLSIAESVKLVPDGGAVSAAAYSFNDTFTVVRGDGVAEDADLADSYNLRMILNELKLRYPSDGADENAVNDIVLDASSGYSKSLCSSDFYYEGAGGELFPLQLRPATEYTLDYYLSWDNLEGNSSEGTFTFKTPKANMSWSMDPEAVADNKLPIKVQLDKNGSTTNTAGLKGQTVSLSAYLRENYEGADYSKLPNDAVEFTSANNYTQTINVDISELKPDVEYELALGVDGDVKADEAAVVVYDTFRFYSTGENGDEGNDPEEDNREIKVTSVEPTFRSVTIEYTLSGNISSDDCVICYYKAKDAQDWIRGDFSWGDDAFPFTITDLSPATAYEYKMGFGSSSYTPASDLAKSVQADFATIADNRKVTADVESKVTKAAIDCTLSGGYANGDLLYCFYKVKDTNDWVCESNQVWYDYSKSFELSELNPETTYDYKIGFASDYIGTPDQLEGTCAEGSFTTLADQRSLSDAKAEVVESGSGPRIKLNAYFSGNIEKEYTYIHYFYREQASAGTDAALLPAWIHYDSVGTLNVKRYCSQYIDDIQQGKTYEYAIVISDGFDLSSPDAVTKEGWKVTGTVEVPPAKAATSVTLSQTDLYMNLSSGEEDGEGNVYVSQSIKADIAPADATKELNCLSSNVNVAFAYYYNGKIMVRAYGVGTAKITVKSPYSDTELAKINVEVGNYAVYIKDGNEVEEISKVAYSKASESKEEYLLYKEESGEMIPVSNYTVTSENEDIVTWNADKRKLVTGKSVGSADLVFTDGKFKARLTVKTYVAAKAFAITGLTKNSSSSYDAIEKDGVYTIANGSSYRAVVKFSPSPYDTIKLSWFDWSSSDTNVATVVNGTITPVGVGEATITAVTDEEDINHQVLPPAAIKIKVVDRPEDPADTPVYVLANTVTLLSDVACPDGWAWKVPETPIVTSAVNSSPYQFDAVYTKGDKYPIESTIDVYIAQVTGMSVSVYGNSDAVLEVAKSSTDAENDLLTLTVKTDYRGEFDASEKKNGYEDYQIEIPAVEGLTIERVKPQNPNYDANGLSNSGSQRFTIKAKKAGNYTLKPAIYVKDANGNRKQLATSVYKLKAVEGSLAESIEIQLTEEAKKNTSIKLDEDDDDRLYIDLISPNNVDASAAESVSEFDVEAILKDWKDAAKTDESATTVTSESLKNTKLTWKVSDTKVATVKADSANSQKAKVTVKGEGHTILTATAKDAAGHSAQLKIEIRNHAPRVSSSTVTVNTAFDYGSYYGLENAHSAAGSVEIIPVYGGDVKKVELYEGDALSSNFKIYEYYPEYEENTVYVIGTKSAEVSAGRKTAELRVTTYENKIYKYPIQVTVVNKPAKITAKSVNTVNLFYTNDGPEVSFKVSGAYHGIFGVKWTDQSSGVGNGFSTNWSYDYNGAAATEYWYALQENISLTDAHKLSDANIVKGEFTVKLYGYRDEYKVPVTIKWNYKKPAIITANYNGKAMASTTIEPSAGVYGNTFYLYDKTNKRGVYYSSYGSYSNQGYYNDLICNNTNAEMQPYTNSYSNYVSYQYTGSKTSGSETIAFKLASNIWREDVTVEHTIKLARPTAALTNAQIVINTNKPDRNSTSIYLKNSGYYARLSDIKVEGKDAKSAKLLDDDLLEISNYNGSSTVYVRQSDARIMGKEPIKAGTYSYKLTPYYTDNSGNRQALNTVILKVKVVNKDITVKAKVKNTLDLVKGTESCNYMEITPVFSNIGTGYSVNSVKLTGEYSKYFTFDSIYDYSNGYRRLKISSEGVGKLKAGQSYKLTLVYTVSMPSGDTFTVTAAPITVKPKQTAPKVKVYNNNQTIYAGADDVIRTYRLETDAYKYKMYGYTNTTYPYMISGVSGSLDCNKDGKADIIVRNTSSGSYICSLNVEIADRDGVLTATGTKGKTYSVPVTVTLIGRDGISRDVKTTIKVTVKR